MNNILLTINVSCPLCMVAVGTPCRRGKGYLIASIFGPPYHLARWEEAIKRVAKPKDG